MLRIVLLLFFLVPSIVMARVVSSDSTEGRFESDLLDESKAQLALRVNTLLENIPLEERLFVVDKLQEIEEIPLAFDMNDSLWADHQLMQGDSSKTLIVFIQGLPAKKRVLRNIEWAHMLYMMQDQNYTVYFQKITRRKYLAENGIALIHNLLTLQQKHPNQKITVFAHCTGGAALLAGIDALNPLLDTLIIHQLSTMKIITMGSPMNNYGAPNIVKSFQFFIPKSRLVLDLGRTGLSFVTIPPSITGTHYINNYAYDHTNTNINGRYLQIRTAHKVATFDAALRQMAMPFGPGSTVLLDGESHFSMIEKILSVELGITDKGRPITGDLIKQNSSAMTN